MQRNHMTASPELFASGQVYPNAENFYLSTDASESISAPDPTD
jgi:hypothetical protein